MAESNVVVSRTGPGIAWVALVLLAWAIPAAAAERVRLGVPATALSMAPVYLAQALGFYADEGLEVERIATQGGGPDVKALIAGQVEFTFTSGDNVIAAYQEGQRLLMVFSGLHRLLINWAMHKDAAKERGITQDSPVDHKLRALNGLSIGVPQLGTLIHRVGEYTVRQVGLVPQKDLKFVPLGDDPAWLAGLESRKVDVALTTVPLPEMAAGRGRTILLINNARGEDPALPEFLMENLIVRPEYLRKNPETVRRMVRAMYKANRWALTNPPEKVAELLQPYLPRTDGKSLLDGVRATLPALTQDGQTTERAVEITTDVLDKAGVLKKKAPYAEIVTNEFVPRQRTFSPWNH